METSHHQSTTNGANQITIQDSTSMTTTQSWIPQLHHSLTEAVPIPCSPLTQPARMPGTVDGIQRWRVPRSRPLSLPSLEGVATRTVQHPSTEMTASLARIALVAKAQKVWINQSPALLPGPEVGLQRSTPKPKIAASSSSSLISKTATWPKNNYNTSTVR